MVDSSNFESHFNVILESLYKGSEFYYKAWLKESKDSGFNKHCSESSNYKGYEFQNKRYTIMKKIGMCQKIGRTDFNFLTKQPEIDSFFNSYGLSYEDLPLEKNIIIDLECKEKLDD
jgi:nitrate reductase beta subunit